MTTRGMNVLLVSVGLLLAAFSIPNDIKNLTIHTIVTKPVERFEIVLGRFLGYLGLVTVGAARHDRVRTGPDQPRERVGGSRDREHEGPRAPVTASWTSPASPGGNDRRRRAISPAWMSVAKTATGSTSPAIHSRRSERSGVSRRCQSGHDKGRRVPLEFAFDIYRTTKGEEGDRRPGHVRGDHSSVGPDEADRRSGEPGRAD